MSESTLLHNLSAEKILEMFQDISNEISEIKTHFEPKTPIEYLTPKEVASLLKCDLSTIYNWAKRGIIVRHGMGNRVYYKRTEIDAALVRISA